jgi:hypothetical protein
MGFHYCTHEILEAEYVHIVYQQIAKWDTTLKLRSLECLLSILRPFAVSPLAVETLKYGCLHSAFDEFLGTCARSTGRRALGRRFGVSPDGVCADLLLSVWGLDQLAA